MVAYQSTRGRAPELSFADVLLTGLAPDGLYQSGVRGRDACRLHAALGGDADSDEPAFQAGVNRLEALQELMLRALAVWLIFAALWAVLPT